MRKGIWNHPHYRQPGAKLANIHKKFSGDAVKAKPNGPVYLRDLIMAMVLSGAGVSYAGPEQGQIQQGLGKISRNGLSTIIEQQSQRLDLSWQSFNLDENETVNFVQPSRSSLAINHILDNNGSRIQGQINANGQVWLINPNGVAFGQQARINVGGLIASTLQEQATGGGRVVFGQQQTGSGEVSNLGQISTTANGYVAFISEQVSNQGEISSPGGTVVLGAGSKISLNFSGSQLLNLHIEQSTLDTLADNQGLIQAEGGQVLMSAGSRSSLLASVVNNDGVITANSVIEQDGKIILLAGMQAGTTQVSGTLDASAKDEPSVLSEGPQAQGGFIETSAHQIVIDPASYISTYAGNGKTGTWLIDPNDYTIAVSGGDISGSQLSTNLGLNNVEIQSDNGTTGSNGNIFINDTITWNSDNTLTLTAKGDIHVNQAITSQHANGKVILNYGQANVAAGNNAQYHINAPINLQAGHNFTTTLGSDGTPINYTVITALGDESSISNSDLQGIGSNLGGHYALGANIDASATSTWNSGAGFTPIGRWSSRFTGRLDGLGHSVDQLSIARTTASYTGVFGVSQGAIITNVGIKDGTVSGKSYLGGLVGWSVSSTISNSYSTAAVAGRTYSQYVGGLVGLSDGSTIIDSFSSGDVSAASWSTYTGGLVGLASSSHVSRSYATGATTGSAIVGGLIGKIQASSTLVNTYASGSTLGSNVGSLVGFNENSSISNSYGTGLVNGGFSGVGGLVGNNTGGTTTNSFWDTISTGENTSAGGTGKTTAELKQLATFSGWDIDSNGGTDKVWRIYDGYTMPLLRSLLTLKTLSTQTVSYDGNAHSYTAPVGDSLLQVKVSQSSYTNAGTYQSSLDDFYSSQQGYDISGAHLVISPIALGLSGQREYNGRNDVGFSLLTLGVADIIGSDEVSLSLSGHAVLTGASPGDAGHYDNSTTAVTDLSLSGAGAGNYTLAGGAHSIIITPKVLSLQGSREYDGSNIINLESLSVNNLVAGDKLTGQFSLNASSVGSYQIGAISQSNSNYQLAGAGNVVTIGLSVSGNREYDGSASFALSDLNVTNLVAGESLNGAITVAASDAGNYSATGLALAESNANYRLVSGTLSITPRTITLNGSREYNGLTGFALNDLSLSNIVAGEGDLLTVNTDATSAGDYDSTTVELGNSNYTLDSSSLLRITARSISAKGSRVYDGSNTVDLASLAVNNLVAGDNLTGRVHISGSNVGRYTLLGLDLGNFNYQISGGDSEVVIVPRVLQLEGNRVYDGSDQVAINQLAMRNLVAGESLSILGEATVGDKGVGQQTLLTDQLSLDNPNYTLDGTAHWVTISPLVINAFVSVRDKNFDDSLLAEIDAINSPDIIAGDQVQFGFSKAEFPALEGMDLTVEVSGINLTGSDANNYVLQNTKISSTASIYRLQEQRVVNAINSFHDNNGRISIQSNGGSPALVLDNINLSNVTQNKSDRSSSQLDNTEPGKVQARNVEQGNFQQSKLIAPINTALVSNSLEPANPGREGCLRLAAASNVNQEQSRQWSRNLGVHITAGGVSIGNDCRSSDLSSIY